MLELMRPPLAIPLCPFHLPLTMLLHVPATGAKRRRWGPELWLVSTAQLSQKFTSDHIAAMSWRVLCLSKRKHRLVWAANPTALRILDLLVCATMYLIAASLVF